MKVEYNAVMYTKYIRLNHITGCYTIKKRQKIDYKTKNIYEIIQKNTFILELPQYNEFCKAAEVYSYIFDMFNAPKSECNTIETTMEGMS